MTIRADLVIPQGKAWVSPTWALVAEDGGGMSVAGRVVRAQVRESARDALVLHEWSTTIGNVIVSTVTVELENDDGPYEIETDAIALAVKPTESAAWPWRAGVYDVEVTNPANPDDVYGVVEESAVRVAAEVTR